MKAVIQKSLEASVEVDGKIVGQIAQGLVVLLGITHDDTNKDLEYILDKLINMRLFEDNDKYFEKSILETSKNILLISQFTLYAGTKKGRRPDFINAAKSEVAKPIYEKFIQRLKDSGINVQTGEFGAEMKVKLTNHGPVTIILDSSEK